MSSFRLFHISDIHLTPFVAPSIFELCSKRITGWLNWRLNRGQMLGEQTLSHLVADMRSQHCDHLVISGDLVNLSLKQEFIQACHWLESLGHPDDVSVIFGNHDAYVPGALQQACQIFSSWIKGDNKQANGEQANTEQANATPFPYCRQRGEVAIIGVNSAVATRPLSARGSFKKPQARRLAEILAEKKGSFRVVVIHHPPIHHAVARHKALKGIDLFQQVIAGQGAELVLHGHSHLPTLNFIHASERQIPVIGVASASQAPGGHKPAANYNIFEINKSDAGWQCWLVRRTLIDGEGNFSQTRQKIKI